MRKIPQAIQECDRALEIDPGFPEVVKFKGILITIK